MPIRVLVILAAAVLTACSQQPARVEVEPQSLRFRSTNQQIAVFARVVDKDGAAIPGKQVFFSSSAPEIATVTADGMVTAVAPGQAQIWASHEKLSVSVDVRVSIPRRLVLKGACGTRCALLSDSPPKFRLEGIDATATLASTVFDDQDEQMEIEVRYEAADPEFAAGARKPLIEVSNTGELRSLGVGRYVVVASAGGAAEKALIEVVLPRVDVVKAEQTMWLKPGTGLELKTATFQRAHDGKLLEIAGAKLSYNSSDPLVATIDDGGRVTAVGEGIAEVVAAADSGAFAHIEVHVSREGKPQPRPEPKKRRTKKKRR